MLEGGQVRGESVEDQDAAGTLSRAQRVERVVQPVQPDAAGSASTPSREHAWPAPLA